MEDEGGDALFSARPTLRELEALQAMVQFSKMTAAAKALGVSQPAVSRSIASLEARLGKALFDRVGGQLLPKPAAIALEREARSIIAALDRLARGRDEAPGPRQIRISVTPTLAHHYLAPILPRFLAQEPGLAPQIEIGTSTEVLRAVTDRQADLGLLDEPTPHAGMRQEIVRRSIAHVMLPTDHRLAEHAVIDVATIGREPLIALPHRFPVRTLIDRAFREMEIEPNVVMEAATTAFAADMVARRIGIAILNPFPLMNGSMRGLVSREFKPIITFNTAVITAAATQPPAVVKRLVAALRGEAASEETSP